MKRSISFLFTVITILTLHAQNITGEWNGALNIQGIKLRVVFHLTKTDAGYSATMDSPDQGAKGIPMTAVSFENNVLKLEQSAIRITYTGTFDGKTEIIGEFVQAGMKFPMNLSRTQTVITKPKRPQEPTQPFPYNSENVTFKNTTDNITLAGTLTYPKGEGKFPVAILISGSGPQNRDEELKGHKPFLVMADYLTRKGFAVLRYDDRGCFASSGKFETAVTQDFASDVSAAVYYIKARSEADLNRIGLIGHSEGGIIAPLVASQRKDIDYIVLMAGPGISGDRILTLQSELIARANGASEKDIEKAKTTNRLIYNEILRNQQLDSCRKSIRKIMKNTLADTDELKNGGEAMINIQLNQLTSPWMLNFIRYNPAPALEKVKCRVLALNGSLDLQVPADINLKAIETALQTGNNKQYKIMKLEGLNHLFQTCKTGSPNEYTSIEGTISPQVLLELESWIIGK